MVFGKGREEGGTKSRRQTAGVIKSSFRWTKATVGEREGWIVDSGGVTQGGKSDNVESMEFQIDYVSLHVLL